MSIGQPVNRLDGPAKVTGQARYTADVPMENLAHAVIVTSSIPRGSITRIRRWQVLSSPGVLRVFTHENTPKFRP